MLKLRINYLFKFERQRTNDRSEIKRLECPVCYFASSRRFIVAESFVDLSLSLSFFLWVFNRHPRQHTVGLFSQEQSLERRWLPNGLHAGPGHAGHDRTSLPEDPTRSAGRHSQRHGLGSRHHCLCLRRAQCQVRDRPIDTGTPTECLFQE